MVKTTNQLSLVGVDDKPWQLGDADIPQVPADISGE